jgi:hypothetical protein
VALQAISKKSICPEKKHWSKLTDRRAVLIEIMEKELSSKTKWARDHHVLATL